MATQIRVSPDTHRRLIRMSKRQDRPVTKVIERLVREADRIPKAASPVEQTGSMAEHPT